MAFPADIGQAPNATTAALQSVSLLINAAKLVAGGARPAFRSMISPHGLPPPGVPVSSLLDLITLDVTLQETHTAESEITIHPVEEGADVSDHARPKPVELRMEGLISDTPLDESLINAAARAIPGLGPVVATAGSILSLLKGSSVTRAAFDALRAVRDSTALCGIYTPYRTYSNMVVESLVITRDPNTGEALHFTAVFREIIFVSSGIATINLPTFAQAARDVGTQAAGAASSKLSNQASVIYQGINSATKGDLDRFGAWVKQ